MPISDLNPQAGSPPTDATLAARALRNLIRSVQNNRQTIARITQIVDRAPGGKAAILTELGGDATEANAMIDALVAYVNTYKATGAADTTNPLA